MFISFYMIYVIYDIYSILVYLNYIENVMKLVHIIKRRTGLYLLYGTLPCIYSLQKIFFHQLFDEDKINSQFQFKMFSPYSPFSNPNESDFFQIKASIKSYLRIMQRLTYSNINVSIGKKDPA